MKEGAFEPTQTVVFSADVLEIMRPCCGHGGIERFERHHLRFAGKRDDWAGPIPDRKALRDNLIQEAWDFILQTEELKSGLVNSTRYLEELLTYLAERKAQFRLLCTIL